MSSVLVVDDNPDLTRNAVSYLGCDYEVQSAQNGSEALGKMRNGFVPSVLFSDIVMPGSPDGFELAKITRAEFPNVGILLTTGWALPEHRGFELLTKPYSLEAVKNWIDRFLGRLANAG